MLRFLFYIAFSACVMFVIFSGMLILVSTLPSTLVYSRLNDTVSTLKKEGLYPSVGFPWRKIVLDNFTDSVMLNIAYSIDSSDPVRSSIRTIQHDGDENSADQILNLEKLSQKRNIHETVYERYWHGYLVFLRPLLAMTSYAGVRIVLSITMFTIFFLFMHASWKQLGIRITYGLLIGFIAVDFFWLGKSLQLSNVFITGMLGSLYLLKKKNISFLEMSVVYFIVGGVTSYIDVLSAPLVSVGLMLIPSVSLIKTIDLKKVVFLCTLWSIGYLSLWSAKWVLAEYTHVPNAINIGYKKVQDRTMGTADEEFSRKTAVIRNVYQLRGYDKRNKILLLVIGVCYALFITRYFSLKFANKKNMIIWTTVALIPYLWYLIAAEHSYIHVLFTYRNQFISVVGAFLVSTEFINWRRVRKDLKFFT